MFLFGSLRSEDVEGLGPDEMVSYGKLGEQIEGVQRNAFTFVFTYMYIYKNKEYKVFSI